MTKQDIAQELAIRADLTKKNSQYIVDSIIEMAIESLERGESVFLKGLGTIKVVDNPERTAHHPQTGKTINVPARKGIRFRPSMGLIYGINGMYNRQKTDREKSTQL